MAKSANLVTTFWVDIHIFIKYKNNIKRMQWMQFSLLIDALTIKRVGNGIEHIGGAM